LDYTAFAKCREHFFKEWPLAFAECDVKKPEKSPKVSLRDHLVRVADLTKLIIEERFTLRVLHGLLPELFAGIDALNLAYVIGLLHDLGKASKYYIESFTGKAGSRLGFPYHELSIPLHMFHAAQSSSELDEQSLAAIHIVAKVISRHHSAMPGRHPLELGGVPDLLRRSVEGLCDERVAKFVDELRKSCNSSFCNLIMEVLTRHLYSEECRKVHTYISIYTLKELAGFKGLWGLPRVNEYAVYRVVAVLTGVLIVADNVVASYEGRESDDKITRLYVKYWTQELSRVLDRWLK